MTETHISRQPLFVDSDSPVHKDRQQRLSVFYTSPEGNPTGGVTEGQGYRIEWQNGVQRPNGAVLEDVIGAAIDRLRFFQGDHPEMDGEPSAGRFSNAHNAKAIEYLDLAIAELNARTRERQAAGTEGSYKV